jgi:hypothetical protein
VRGNIAARARPPDCPNSKTNIAAHVERALELQLAVEVAVIAELMSFVGDAPHELGPAFGVTSEHEESGPHTLCGQRVENYRGCVGIGAIIEGQRHDLLVALDSAERGTEQRTVAVKGTVDGSADYRHSQSCIADHSCVARLNTAV